MNTVHLIWIYLTAFMCMCGVIGTPIGTSNINCDTPLDEIRVGSVVEGYTGAVEVLNGIPEGISVSLISYAFPDHLNFLELIFTLGDTSAIVQTKMPLDADILLDTGGVLYYSVQCSASGVVNYRTLKIIDENDNSPIFEQKAYNKVLSETLSVDSEVLKVVATDADVSVEHSTLSYSIVPPGTPYFIVDIVNGGIILKKRLNYNLIKNYNFTVEAKDNGGKSDSTVVLFNVADFDNLNPYFNHNLYHASIHENQIGPFDTILPEAIKAQDGDTGINVPIFYSISTVSPSKYHSNFNIAVSSGVISVVTAIDREELDSNIITVSIKAAQTDDNLKTAGAVVSVTVEDVNDNPPEFDQSSYSVPLLENSPVGAVVLKVVLTDKDEGGFNGTLRILPESVPFSVSSDGAVRVKNSAALDRETSEIFIFQVEARETEAPNHVAVADVNVTLLDENDNSPTFERNTYEGTVSKNQTVGMLVTQVKAVDPDQGPNGEVTYTIDFGNQEGYFSIDENNGRITLNKTIPLEKNKILEFSLYVTARDGGRVSRSSSVLVSVRAPGDSRPQYLESTYSGSIEEEQDPDVIITRVRFQGIASAVTLRVETHADKFVIDNDGVFSSKVKLDYDEAPHNYSVAISLSDGNTTDSAVVEVRVTDINDNAPVFASSSVTQIVPEDGSVGMNVTAFVATDKDSGINGEIQYSLQGGEGKFSVDPNSGVVSLAGDLDRETKEEYRVLVVASDQGYPAMSATASLIVQVSDINDNTPVFTEAEYEVEVLETESVGKPLLTLSAVDPDKGANGAVTYHIFQQNPPSTPVVFLLDSSTGVLSLSRTLDYSETKVYSLVVQAADGGSPSLVGNGSVVVKVRDVNNNPPQFSRDSYDVAVSESLSSGSSILTLEVTDIDEGGFSKGFFLYTSDTFEINQQGVVSLSKNATLDRETKDHYIMQVVAVDQPVAGLSSTAQLNVTVLDFNDNSPQFPHLPEALLIPEGQYSDMSPGVVIRILATDADLGPNGEVTLSFPSPNPLFRFTEDGTLLAVGSLDRESRDSYELVIKASDGGTPQRENFTTITVSITDINDNTPVFTEAEYQVEVSETESVGKPLRTLSAVDPDKGANGTVTYHIFQQNPPSTPAVFLLDSSTGVLSLSHTLDYSETKVYSLVVQAADGGSPSLVGNGSVVVKVRDVNNNPPQFSRDSYDVAVSESLSSGSSILTLEVTDRDEGGFSKGFFLYTSDTFEINQQGVVSLNKNATLDRETKDHYIIQVVAVDQPVAGLSSTAQLNVTVLDFNDNSPQFPHLPEALLIPEGQYSDMSPGEVIRILATDADLGPNGEVTLSFPSPNPLFRFTEDGTLLAVGALDRESRDSYELVIKASDGGTPQRENFTTITVSITDINDNTPVFSASIYTNSILVTDAKEGDVVLTLTATDKDLGNNSLITYSFSEGASPYLAVDSETGAVTLTSDLADVTEDTTLELTAMAKDHGQPPLNSTAGVVIKLRINTLTEGVVFENSSYNFRLPENQPMGTSVGAVKASAGGNHDVTYRLTTHTDLFSIDASGALTARETLDKETQDWYILEVEAVDTRVPPTSAVALVKVQVEDVNETPQFSSDSYNVKIFSIAPYKSPVVQVKATDPDIGDIGQLVYSLSAASDYFDIDRSTGEVFVVSVTALAGEKMSLQVKATDPDGLFATTKVEVEVKGSASSSDIVVISINQPANIVEKKVAEMEESLGKALGWTVKVIDVSGSSGSNTHRHSGYSLSRESSKSFISFISIDEEDVVSSEEVTEKLKSEAVTVKAELEKVFGEGLQHEVEEEEGAPSTSQATVIALGVLLALSILGLLLMVTFTIVKRFRKIKKHQEDSYRESFDIGKPSNGYINTGMTTETETTESESSASETSERARSDSKSSQVVEPKTTGVASNGTETSTHTSGADREEMKIMGKDSKSSTVETHIAHEKDREASKNVRVTDVGETSDSDFL